MGSGGALPRQYMGVTPSGVIFSKLMNGWEVRAELPGLGQSSSEA